MAKTLFFICLTLISVLLAVGLYQVPQPWRGILVGWLLFALTVGTMILRLARHYFAFKSLQLTTRGPGQAGRTKHEQPTRKHQYEGLRVVMSTSGGGGRRVVR
jgi:hypothetical protein